MHQRPLESVLGQALRSCASPNAGASSTERRKRVWLLLTCEFVTESDPEIVTVRCQPSHVEVFPTPPILKREQWQILTNSPQPVVDVVRLHYNSGLSSVLMLVFVTFVTFVCSPFTVLFFFAPAARVSFSLPVIHWRKHALRVTESQ